MAFALTPAQAHSGVIDMSTTEGRKLYAKAIAPLQEELYDCIPDGLFGFLKELEDRSADHDWNDTDGILKIPEDPNDASTTYDDLLMHYGQIPIERIRIFEETYIDRECLTNSISKEGKTKILVWEEDYKIDEFKSGILLQKVIIRESHLDTNATTSSIRTKLSELDVYLPTIASDITKFNQYVKLLLAALHARGKKTEDLLTNLFKGYLAALDKEEYEEGTVSIEPDTLMGLADVKFKTLKQQGSWAPTPEEEKILALQSKVKPLKKTYKKPPAAKQGDKSDAGKTDGDKPGWLHHNRKPYHKDAKKPKTWNASKYYWCSSYTGGKCTGKGLEFRNKQSDDAEPKRMPDAGSQEPKKKLKLTTKAYSALADADSEDSK
eukprot:scaffold88424_cov63-Attheya_sp.AAC.2